MLRNWGMLVVMLLLTPMLAFAQNTGKISGRVTDRDTGETLPGANVSLVGTTYGSITDVDGNYFILGVPVGAYDVEASFVGYTPERVTGVQVSSGYTQEVNLSISAGVELDEVVVEYERPLIQKDAVGAPKIIDAEEIVNLPVRGAANVAAIQAGVVSTEGSSTLNIRGGRGAEVDYYIDGVKVIGSTSIPQSAVQEQEIMIGNISARYGDAMSGIINITTKSGSREFFGSIEGITSEALDSYGYNLLSAAVGGPVAGNALNFFLAGEYLDQLDSGPRAIAELKLPESILNDLRAAPQAFTIQDVNGDDAFLPIPASLADGARLVVDDDGHPVVTNNQISFDDGTTISLPDSADINTLLLDPVFRADLVDSDLFERSNAQAGAANKNLTLSLFDQGRLRVGGRYITGENEGLSFADVVFAPENVSQTERDQYQVFGTWTQHLSGSTFYQLQGDYSNTFSETYDPRFGKDEDDWLRYGDISEDAFLALRGYKDAPTLVTEERIVGTDTISVQVPQFNASYGDDDDPAPNVVGGLVNTIGGRHQGYSKSKSTQFRLTASATTQVGINQLEFGGEYETRVSRSWSITAAGLARYVNDGDPEGIDPTDPAYRPQGYDSYQDFVDNAIFILDNFAGGTGYDVTGRNETDEEDFEAFLDTDRFKGNLGRQVAPPKPIYYGGYVQDKIEFRDIVLNLGLRVDVFDNNVRVLKDPYSRRPIERADVIAGRPTNIGEDFAVYYDGDSDVVLGYRDVEGRYFDSNGQEVQAAVILLNNGKPKQLSSQIREDMFEDYEPQVTAMPRIGVSFPVTDRALFFASYGIVSQRPSSNSFASLAALSGTGTINNNNLKPERTTKYELGFRQRVGERAALTISGFFQQIDNLIQQKYRRGAFPSDYITYENVDFGTVKGMEFGFDMRRNNGFAANLNYTLSFADGTGSGANTTGTINWVDETPPNFISPLDFDQRHRLNLSVDYRLGAGEGPSLGGAHILANFGLNVLYTAGSGYPYTAIQEPYPVTVSRAPRPSGGVNENRSPSVNRIDLKLDRRFQIGGDASVTAFLWIENVLDADNVQSVWRATGLGNNDGFLATTEGQAYLASGSPSTAALYDYNTNLRGNYGIPRQTRLGVRLDF